MNLIYFFKFSTKEQEYKNKYQYVKYRNADDYHT